MHEDGLDGDADPHFQWLLEGEQGKPLKADRISTRLAARLAVDQRCAISVEKYHRQFVRLGLRQGKLGRGHIDAGDEPRDLPRRGRQRCLVEVVQIEIRETVVTLITAEVLEMKITSCPTHWALRQ